jgi:methylenetetrahydrofolate reductase (NADPH)
VIDIVSGYRDVGLDNLLALAGDPPLDGVERPSDFRYATDLIEVVRELGDFSVGVAAFPELHPHSDGDRVSERRHLADKLRLADFGITQFFFKADDYFRMLDELAALGVDTPVLAGVIPVTNFAQVERFAQLAGARFPDDLAGELEAVSHLPEEVRRIGVQVATELTQELLDRGAPGIHFYTLNFAKATKEIWANLGLSHQR